MTATISKIVVLKLIAAKGRSMDGFSIDRHLQNHSERPRMKVCCRALGIVLFALLSQWSSASYSEFQDAFDKMQIENEDLSKFNSERVNEAYQRIFVNQLIKHHQPARDPAGVRYFTDQVTELRYRYVFRLDVAKRYATAVEKAGYDELIDDDDIQPGPIAIACLPVPTETFLYTAYKGLYSGSYKCDIKVEAIGQGRTQLTAVHCANGDCKANDGTLLGHWVDPFEAEIPNKPTFVTLPTGYYFWQGIAYRVGYGPAYEKKAQDIGSKVHEDIADENAIKARIAKIKAFFVGIFEWFKELFSSKSTVEVQQVAEPKTPTAINAWCNPQADDDCYVNEEKVAIKDLPKHFPISDCTEESGLTKEPGSPLCFDHDGNAKAVSAEYYRQP